MRHARVAAVSGCCRAGIAACFQGGWMEHPGFFERAAPIRLDALAEKVGGQLGSGADPAQLIHDVKGLADADAGHVTYFDNRKYLSLLGSTRASACLVAPAFDRSGSRHARSWPAARLQPEQAEAGGPRKVNAVVV